MSSPFHLSASMIRAEIINILTSCSGFYIMMPVSHFINIAKYISSGLQFTNTLSRIFIINYQLSVLIVSFSFQSGDLKRYLIFFIALTLLSSQHLREPNAAIRSLRQTATDATMTSMSSAVRSIVRWKTSPSQPLRRRGLFSCARRRARRQSLRLDGTFHRTPARRTYVYVSSMKFAGGQPPGSTRERRSSSGKKSANSFS